MGATRRGGVWGRRVVAPKTDSAGQPFKGEWYGLPGEANYEARLPSWNHAQAMQKETRRVQIHRERAANVLRHRIVVPPTPSGNVCDDDRVVYVGTEDEPRSMVFCDAFFEDFDAGLEDLWDFSPEEIADLKKAGRSDGDPDPDLGSAFVEHFSELTFKERDRMIDPDNGWYARLSDFSGRQIGLMVHVLMHLATPDGSKQAL